VAADAERNAADASAGAVELAARDVDDGEDFE